MSDDLNSQINKLRKKAELCRNAHFMLFERKKTLGNWLHFSILIGSSMTAVLTFANFDVFLPLVNNLKDNEYKLIIGAFASIVFILSVTEEFLRLSSHASEHGNAAKQLTSFIRNADLLEKQEKVTEYDLSILNTNYTMINEAAPNIPDKIFLKAKKRLLEKIATSKELEQNPFMSVLLFKFKRRVSAYRQK